MTRLQALSREQILELTVEDLALLILADYNAKFRENKRGECFSNICSEQRYGDDAGRLIAEAWSWLIQQGLLVLRPGSNDWYVPSREGETIKSRENLDFLRHARLL